MLNQRPDSENSSSIACARTELSKLLLDLRTDGGWWEGELSTSALSTATAVMALSLAARQPGLNQECADRYDRLIQNGLAWLVRHQNEDGGWGDTVLSLSNISTTMLANAVFHATGTGDENAAVVEASQQYIDRAGGTEAVVRRYGKDRTFSVPILTHCALAGIIDWKHVIPLPFELSCIPVRFYAALRLPVVSYALPALIAIGQVIFHHRGHWNPVVRLIRRSAINRSLRVLESIQPSNGGFLEATPLTSFVCMSLLGCGYFDHPVTRKCLQFIEDSVRSDGSWPIDTNLTTWVTTLSVNALSGDPSGPENSVGRLLNDSEREQIRCWLLGQQYQDIHPYTNAAPGGWSWTDLPGGVPDADDTPGAMLAILNLRPTGEQFTQAETTALKNAACWLLDLQNRDGGWPTFCRGWGALPFDRSSNDLTAHALRALALWQARVAEIPTSLAVRAETAIGRGLKFLQKTQAADGSWLPLWFGNQFHPHEENPLYGTAKVVLALRDTGQADRACTRKAVDWLLQNQNEDYGWSGRRGLASSTEETALAVEALAGLPQAARAVDSGAAWLAERVADGSVADPAPIGFYFAKLWYFEQLYPIIFATAALRRCVRGGSADL
ncbi:MAG: prenyltransferase/squalene oxidase repeat-containing protein [Fuerstiella sp.]